MSMPTESAAATSQKYRLEKKHVHIDIAGRSLTLFCAQRGKLHIVFSIASCSGQTRKHFATMHPYGK